MTEPREPTEFELRQKVAVMRRLIAAKESALSLIRFSKFMEPDPNAPDDLTKSLYTDQAHHRVVAALLEQAESGALLAQGIRYLCISIGPQKGKSQICTRNFPAWAEGKNPKRNIMVGSYNDDFSREFGDDVRNIMLKPQYAQVFPRARLRKGGKAKDHMVTDAGGKMNFIGRGGSGTGKPADIFIVDDPIKNDEEAASLTIRNTVWNWFLRVADSRTHGNSIIIVIQCMTGDTPVLMATGREKSLRDIRPGDAVATYDNGVVATSTVLNWVNHGPDRVYAIRMKSGIIVKANARHPFLVEEGGETKWQRTATLRPGSVILRVIGANGRVSFARERGAIGPPDAKAYATRTTTSKNGNQEHVRLLPTLNLGVKRICATATELTSRNMIVSWLSRAAFVPFANSLQRNTMPALTGAESSASITATTAKRSEGFSATTAILRSVTEKLKKSFSPPLSTCEITRDVVVEVVDAGIEDVFDVQIDRTENFIAGGLVSHNTRWHEDDLIGRLTDSTNPHYPKKMAAMTKYINIPSIVDDPELAKALGVPVGGSIWEEKFPLKHLQMRQDADPRGFGAMEMGRPTPPEGSFYKVDQIRRCWYKDVKELPKGLRKYGSGDLAVSDDLTADWSVVGDWGLDENDILWLMPEIYWMRKKADQTVEHLVTKGKDNWQTFFGEKGQIDRSIRPFLEKRMMEEECFFAVQTFPNVNKGQASLSFRGRLAQGKVRFPVFAEWYQRAEEQMLKFTGSGDDREDDFCDMLARIGQGLQLQVRGSRPQADNVVKLVQPGSIGWAFRQYSNKQEKAKKVSALRGM